MLMLGWPRSLWHWSKAARTFFVDPIAHVYVMPVVRVPNGAGL